MFLLWTSSLLLCYTLRNLATRNKVKYFLKISTKRPSFLLQVVLKLSYLQIYIYFLTPLMMIRYCPLLVFIGLFTIWIGKLSFNVNNVCRVLLGGYLSYCLILPFLCFGNSHPGLAKVCLSIVLEDMVFEVHNKFDHLNSFIFHVLIKIVNIIL